MTSPVEILQPDGRSQSEQAYYALRELIVTLELPPGSLVDERELMDRLGLGRTPVREALRALAQAKLVEVYPRRGMFVAPADIEVSGPAEEPRLIAWSAGGERKVPTRLIDLQLGPDYVGCVGVLSHRTPLARLIEGDELLAAAAVPLRTTTV